MRKKLLATIFSAVMVASVLTGCGGGDTASTDSSADTTPDTTTEAASEDAAEPASEDTAASDASASSDGSYEECTLTFDWWGGDSRHEATIAAIEAFEKAYPGIKIEYNYGAWSDWETAKATEYVSGTNPDVQQTNMDWIAKYDANNDVFLDLNTVSDTLDLSSYDPSSLALLVDSNGGQAAIPTSLTGRLFYFNKGTFEQAGLEVPTTWADLRAAGPVFRDTLGDNYYPLVVGAYDRAILVAFYIQAQTGTPVIDENGNTTFTLDQLKEGMQWIKDLESEHVIPTCDYIDGEGADSMDKSARFINGEYAGLFEWDSSAKKYVDALGDNSANLVVGGELEDLGPNGSGVFQKVSTAFSISAKTEHPHEAALFLNYLVNDEEGTSLMASERGIPASSKAYDVVNAAGGIDALTAEAHDAVMNANPMYWNPLFDDSTLKGDNSAYNDSYAGLSYGDYDVDTAAQLLYDAYTAVAPAK